MRSHVRVVEVVLAQALPETSPDDLLPPLELVKGKVDAGTSQVSEGALEPFRGDQPSEIAGLAPGGAE